MDSFLQPERNDGVILRQLLSDVTIGNDEGC